MMLPMTREQEVERALHYIYKFQARDLTLDEFKRAVKLKFFRLCTFYYIKDATGKKVRFSPNIAQLEFYKSSHQNNIILKARQLGFTTWKMIADLDDCLFKSDYAAGCIAHNDKSAKDIYRNKVKYAYRSIKPSIIKMLEAIGYKLPKPLNDRDNAYIFSNGSEISVSTGFRGGTLQSLHISEFGKICKKFPEKAIEIVTGAFPAVSGEGGSITIESTAEGRQGYFYEYCDKAKKKLDRGAELMPEDFKFHFFAWWQDPKYKTVSVFDYSELGQYFDELEHKYGIKLTEEQKNWYFSKHEVQGDKMKQEFPSTPEEAFAQAIEGAYYAKQFADIYKDGRYIDKLYGNDARVNTAWDIGMGDSTAIWFYQRVGNEIHVIYYLENSGEPLGYYIKELERLANKHKWVYGEHFAPHDINNRDWSSNGKTRKEMAREGTEYGGVKYRLIFEETPKLGIDDGIEIVRNTLPRCVFFTGLGGLKNEDKGGMSSGVEFGVNALESYRKEWNDKLGCWRDRPLHDWSSHGSDAFRYLAVAENKRVQGFKVGMGW
jgi:hypothetical protein